MDSRGHSRSAISRGQSRSDVVASSAATHTSTGSSRPVTVCKPNSRHQRRQWQAIPTTPPFVWCLRRGFMSFVRPIWRPRVTLKWGPGRCPSAAFVSVSPHPLESIIRRCLPLAFHCMCSFSFRVQLTLTVSPRRARVDLLRSIPPLVGTRRMVGTQRRTWTSSRSLRAH